ncbi:DUF234 domain-containing protein [Herbivorax sp. ANBcel31]|uniref:DUF234 domain-containing protein n=1 Tax=Herbivorax sp. ANBcel31 TaxID=3069754 RepID=UPI0027B6E467|nr:DUF234 domain-containing protein [Herbivorax sp. ANBcel31]MDQ2084944.1 DUF234 domain-containing protein [Herbivorax sp. ANBcel31]
MKTLIELRIIEKILPVTDKARNLPFVFKNIGKWWGNNKIEKRQEKIDILAFYENKVIYDECKYKNEKMSTEVYFDLKSKSELINIGSEKYYYLFSKSGFKNKLIDLSKKDTKIKLVDLMMIVS